MPYATTDLPPPLPLVRGHFVLAGLTGDGSSCNIQVSSLAPYSEVLSLILAWCTRAISTITYYNLKDLP